MKKYRLPDTEIAKIVSKIQNWGYAKFIKNGDTSPPSTGMDTVLLSLRIHVFTVEPGSSAEGRTIRDLDLKERYGVADYGLRRNNTMMTVADDTEVLSAGDALLVFCTDQVAAEIRPLFRQGDNSPPE